MREYGQVQCSYWQSDDALKASNVGKLLAIYLLTGPHSNGIGCYRCPDGYIMADLGWSQETVSEGFAELSRNGFAYRFEGVVCVPNFLRWNKIANGNVAKARLGEFWALPKGQAKTLAARALLTFCGFLSDDDRDALETVCQTVPVTVCRPEPNPTQILPRENPDPSSVPSDSSSAAPTDLLGGAAKPPPDAPADLAARRSERIAKVTEDAITAYNSGMAKPAGLLAAVNVRVGRGKRQEQVRRCLQTASEICDDQFGDKRITPEFWESYFGACLADDFHSGRGPYSGSHANWRPDFEFLTRPATMLKVFDRATAEDAA